MKRFLAIAALLLFSGMCWARTHVQTNVNFNTSGTTTISVVLGSNPTTGNTVCVSIFAYPTGLTGMAIKDANNNTYTLSAHSPSRDVHSGDTTGDLWLAYLPNAPSNASKTITATWTGSASATTIIADEFSGASTYDKDAAQGSADSGGGTTANTPSLTPSASGELLYAGMIPQYHMAAPAPGGTLGSWTGGNWDSATGGDTWLTSEYILSGSGSSTAVDYTLSGVGDDYTSLEMALAPSSGAIHYICGSTSSPCNGSDSNNGTSKTTAWLHAPGMPNCTASCASYSPAAGDQIIFRGGDTWHFGNSGATPYVGGKWAWTWSGSSGNLIYVGVDPTWYSGGSWSRPIMSGDNPASTSTTLSGCTYQVSGGNDFVDFSSRSYFTFDNFEFTGICSQTASPPFGNDVYVSDGSATHSLFEHLYFHGWTHKQFNCGSQCFSIFLFLGGQGGGQQIGMQYQYNVVDGADSDPAGAGTFYDGMYDVSYNVFTNAAQMIGSLCHTFHDNAVSNWYDPGDGVAHGNVFECVTEATGTNFYYNNVFHHISPNGVAQANFWIGPVSGTTDYFFNNLFYDVGTAGNYFNIQNSGGGPVYAFNSTLQSGVSSALMECQGGSSTHAYNMHFITDVSPFYNGTCATATNLSQNNSTANGQGYTSAETYAYSPASGGAGTVGTGTNEQSLCTTINGIDSTAGASCKNDTGYACTYNSSNHTVSCPARTANSRPSSTAWDVGAYQFSGSTPTASTPTFSPVAGIYVGTQSVTISTSSGGAIICYTITGTTPATNGSTGCTTGTLYSTAVSVPVSETLKAVAGGTGFIDSSVGSAAYVINARSAGALQNGTILLNGAMIQ